MLIIDSFILFHRYVFQTRIAFLYDFYIALLL